ncbi:MAG: DUF1376 domain-containing protein [Gemmataceae bacterium]
MKRPPFFAFYPADFANDINVEAMSTLQVGAYMLLLCKAWQAEPPASLPNDDQILARLARVDAATWAEIKAGVLVPFRVGEDGRLHSKRLRLEYDNAMQRMQANRDKARGAAKSRWSKKGTCSEHAPSMRQAMPEQCPSNATEIRDWRLENTEEFAADAAPATGSEPNPEPEPADTPEAQPAAKPTTPKPKPAPRANKPRERNLLFDAVAEVTGLDAVTAGSHIGKVSSILAGADPPYTPDEVRTFGKRFPELCSYARGERTRPTLGELQKNIGLVRADKSPPVVARPRPLAENPMIRGAVLDEIHPPKGSPCKLSTASQTVSRPTTSTPSAL